MKLFVLIFALTLGLTTISKAQDRAPIFVNPYNAQQNQSNTPYIIQNNRASSSSRTSSRSQGTTRSGSKLISMNPFENTQLGKIRVEKMYNDPETGKKINQYDYLGKLAKNGNTQQLAATANFLQQHGVFDQQKYRTTIINALQEKKNEKAAAALSQNQNGSEAQIQPQNTVRQIYRQLDNSGMPTRTHGGYDDDEPATNNAPSNNRAPIFLQ